MNGAAASTGLERGVITKLYWRLMPLLGVCYVVAFLDRVNVGFAKLTMLVDLQLSEQVYAFGAGIFFVGYFLFEVPSNLLLVKFGARVWIARILLVWGLISCLMLAVTDATSFYVLRFLLGAAEAGFFPGVIYYLTLWFPAAYRVRAISSFMVAAVVALLIGGPVSGWLMDNPAFGFRGWQWLFLVEGAPAVLLAFVVLYALPEGPARAKWLSEAERSWLQQRLQSERSSAERSAPQDLAETRPARAPAFASLLGRPRVWLLCSVYFMNVVGGYGLDFFAASLLKNVLPEASPTRLGLLLAVPPLIAIPILLAYGRLSDVKFAAGSATAAAAFAFAAGLLVLALPLGPLGTLLAMTVCTAARWCLIAPFWGLATHVLGASASAAGIAWINSVGNLGGQAGPVILGALRDESGYSRGLYVLSALLAVAGVVALAVKPRAR